MEDFNVRRFSKKLFSYIWFRHKLISRVPPSSPSEISAFSQNIAQAVLVYEHAYRPTLMQYLNKHTSRIGQSKVLFWTHISFLCLQVRLLNDNVFDYFLTTFSIAAEVAVFSYSNGFDDALPYASTFCNSFFEIELSEGFYNSGGWDGLTKYIKDTSCQDLYSKVDEEITILDSACDLLPKIICLKNEYFAAERRERFLSTQILKIGDIARDGKTKVLVSNVLHWDFKENQRISELKPGRFKRMANVKHKRNKSDSSLFIEQESHPLNMGDNKLIEHDAQPLYMDSKVLMKEVDNKSSDFRCPSKFRSAQTKTNMLSHGFTEPSHSDSIIHGKNVQTLEKIQQLQIAGEIINSHQEKQSLNNQLLSDVKPRTRFSVTKVEESLIHATDILTSEKVQQSKIKEGILIMHHEKQVLNNQLLRDLKPRTRFLVTKVDESTILGKNIPTSEKIQQLQIKEILSRHQEQQTLNNQLLSDVKPCTRFSVTKVDESLIHGSDITTSEKVQQLKIKAETPRRHQEKQASNNQLLSDVIKCTRFSVSKVESNEKDGVGKRNNESTSENLAEAYELANEDGNLSEFMTSLEELGFICMDIKNFQEKKADLFPNYAEIFERSRSLWNKYLPKTHCIILIPNDASINRISHCLPTRGKCQRTYATELCEPNETNLHSPLGEKYSDKSEKVQKVRNFSPHQLKAEATVDTEEKVKNDRLERVSEKWLHIFGRSCPNSEDFSDYVEDETVEIQKDGNVKFKRKVTFATYPSISYYQKEDSSTEPSTSTSPTLKKSKISERRKFFSRQNACVSDVEFSSTNCEESSHNVQSSVGFFERISKIKLSKGSKSKTAQDGEKEEKDL